MKRFAPFAAALALAVLPQVAFAQELTDPLESTENLTFADGSGVKGAWDNVQLGPYTAWLESDPTRPLLTIYCVDFANGISAGTNWNVNVTNLAPGPVDLSATRLSGVADQGSALLRYKKAAFLASLFESWDDLGEIVSFVNPAGGASVTFAEYLTPATPGKEKRSVWSGIHAAIWEIMTPGFPNSFHGVDNKPLAEAMALAFRGVADQAASANFLGMDFSEWAVLSDVNASGGIGGKQEYLVRTQVVPEPETYVLIATGLLLLFGVARKRLRGLGYV